MEQRKGQRCKTLLLEKKKFPRDKFCGDAVCKTAIEILVEMEIYEQLLVENKARIVSILLTVCIIYCKSCNRTELSETTITLQVLDNKIVYACSRKRTLLMIVYNISWLFR